MKELGDITKNPMEDITVHVNQQDVTDIQATITGPGAFGPEFLC